MKKLTLVTEPDKLSLNNSKTVELSRLVKVNQIKLRKEFKNLFPINKVNLEKIARRMKDDGYDNSQPVHIWKDGNDHVLIDGHHRRLAAMEAGLPEIPVFIHEFDCVEDAIEYSLSLQTERRNLNDAELLSALDVLDSLKRRGKGSKGEKGKSAERTAKALGTSTTKVEKARAIAQRASEDIKAAVEKGELSLNQAYNKLRVKRQHNNNKANIHQKGVIAFLVRAADLLKDDPDAVKTLAEGFLDPQKAIDFLKDLETDQNITEQECSDELVLQI